MFTELGMELPSREDTTNMKHRTLPSKPPAPDTSRQTTGKTRVTKSMIAQGCYEWQVDGSSGASDVDEDYAFPDQFHDDLGVEYLVPVREADKLFHPSPPASLTEDPEGSESSDDSETPGTLTCGIKVFT
ncbi:hypothetical protein BSL78_22532 [Apostichopus japonicus]|uniref:Uncharacterized protein n=1 Tax=Stichopus japonicus TaxID=307972 RepID=A0A2G8JY59_STIJA|nr:hypothetical protein BSL78_22532 [Apostichopus japonicus]